MSTPPRSTGPSSTAGGASPASSARPPSVSRTAGTPTKDASRAAAAAATPTGQSTSRSHASSSSRAAGASAGNAAAEAELVAQLQERLAQLEADAKSSQDQAQWTIKQNKNTLMALKQENKDLSAEVSKRGGSNELQGKSGSASDGGKVVERLERQVHELRRGYDKIAKDKKTALQKLDNLHDSLRDLAKLAGAAQSHGSHSSSVPVNASISSTASGATLAAISAAAASLPANSPAARELRQLQNRLDKATVKADEAYSIRKTYEQVLEKLRVEEPLLDARIRALQEQRATKQSALQAAALSGREAHAAKEAAKQQLAALEEELAAGRARRGRVLAEMREKAATLQQTNRALMQRQFQPLVTASSSEAHLTHEHSAAAAASPAGSSKPGAGSAKGADAAADADGGAGGDDALHASSLSTATAAAVEHGEGDDITARDLVVRLCRATGSRRVSELLARLLTQQESYANLVSMRSAATTQRLALAQELEVLRTHREELRGGGKMSTQRQLDAAQEELREAATRADAAAASLEGLLKGWADVRSGLEHLAALVAPLPLPAGGQPAVPVEDETLGDVLAQIESRLHNAYKLIAALPKAAELLEANYAALRTDQ